MLVGSALDPPLCSGCRALISMVTASLAWVHIICPFYERCQAKTPSHKLNALNRGKGGWLPCESSRWRSRSRPWGCGRILWQRRWRRAEGSGPAPGGDTPAPARTSYSNTRSKVQRQYLHIQQGSCSWRQVKFRTVLMPLEMKSKTDFTINTNARLKLRLNIKLSCKRRISDSLCSVSLKDFLRIRRFKKGRWDLSRSASE